MQYDHYMSEYRLFNTEHFPDATIEDIEDKMQEEMKELYREIENSGTRANRIAECTDVLNMSLKLLDAYGIKDPLFAGWEKLQATSVKYKLQSSGLSDRK